MDMWKEIGSKGDTGCCFRCIGENESRACGADVVVAEGSRGRQGHIGENTTMVLVPQIADAVKIPVIAAGGIGDGRGMAAAFMLGAKGVQIGTRFVVTKEAMVHENYKARIIKATDIDSRVTGRRCPGHPVRALRNRMTEKEYLEVGKRKGHRRKNWNCWHWVDLRKAVCRRRCYGRKCNGGTDRRPCQRTKSACKAVDSNRLVI